jgi:hypothetical protein
MRTTLDIDDDVLAAVRARAEQERASLGKVVSQLVREALTQDAPELVMKNGILVINRPPGSKVVITPEHVQKLLEDDDLPA